MAFQREKQATTLAIFKMDPNFRKMTLDELMDFKPENVVPESRKESIDAVEQMVQKEVHQVMKKQTTAKKTRTARKAKVAVIIEVLA